MTDLEPTLRNLKKVVRKAIEPEPYARYIVRPVSIYFTWIFVRTPITANQVTLLQELLGIAGAIMLGLGNSTAAVWGVGLLQLGYILDCSDGEVARWNGTQSVKGVFLDLVGHAIVIPVYMFGLGFGVWQRTGRLEALIAGFLAALFVTRLERNTSLSVVDSLLERVGTPPYTLDELQPKLEQPVELQEMGSAGQIGRRSLIQIFVRYPDSMNIITLVVLIDYFLANSIADTGAPLISYYLILVYGALLTLGRVAQIAKVFRGNLTELRFLQIIKSVTKMGATPLVTKREDKS